MKKGKMPKKNKFRIAFIISLLIVLFIGYLVIPVKFAVKEENFKNYEPYILVREVHYTGTGWIIVGDENGYYPPQNCRDVELINGNKLPSLMNVFDDNYANTYLCQVEYKGQTDHDACGRIDSYRILTWYPVYPILRPEDDIWPLPKWIKSSNYLSLGELW